MSGILESVHLFSDTPTQATEPKGHDWSRRPVLTNTALALGQLALILLERAWIAPDHHGLGPAPGLLFAATWAWGWRRCWPGIFIGCLLTGLLGSAPTLAWPMAVATTVQAVIGGAWLRRHIGLDPPSFSTQVVSFVTAVPLLCLLVPLAEHLLLVVTGALPVAQLGMAVWSAWLGDALAALVFVPVFMILIGAGPGWRQRVWTVGVPFVVYYGFILLVQERLQAAADDEAERDLLASIEPVRTELGQLDRVYATTLRRLAEEYEERGATPGAEFETLAARIIDDMPVFRAISWSPVQRADAPDPTAPATRYPPGFTPSPQGLVAPLRLIVPLAGNVAALGVDLLGEPLRAATAEAAIRTGLQHTTPVLHLTQEPGGPGAWLLMTPLRGPDGVGLLNGVLDLQFLSNTFSTLPGTTWELWELDHPSPRSVWSTLPSPAPDLDTAAAADSVADAEAVWARQGFTITRRRYDLITRRDRVVAFSLESHAQHVSTPLLGLTLSTVTTALLGSFLLLLSADRARFAAEVERTTRALRESEQFLTGVIENSGALIFAKNREGVYRMVNRKWEETTGLKRERVLGRTDLELFPGEVGVAFRALDVEVMERGELLEREETLDGPEGRRWFWSIKFPLRDPSGQVTGLCGMTTEITERKQAEDALRSARDAAQSADLAKSQFLATMSHEIRTPMNGILGMAQLLLIEDRDREERREYLKIILDSGRTLLTILNDILDLSKIEAGRMELMDEPYDPVAVLTETTALFRELAQEKGLTLRTEIEAPPGKGLGRRRGDAIRIRQMLSNYLGNAVKFSERGEVVVSLREVIEGDVPRLEFVVRDPGIGIPADKVASLFQPFTQVDGSASRRFGGSGLGLSIVRRLAQQMGGGVGVESQEGAGSRFWFTVKAERVEARSTSRLPTPSAMDGMSDTSRASLAPWVLVAEDSPVNQVVVRRMLTRLGVEARIVGDGADVVALIDSFDDDPPALILMDCQMPQVDGFEATRRIRESEAEHRRARVPILALSAAVFEEDRQRCIEAGMDGFLPKPLVLDELARALSAHRVPVIRPSG